MDRESPRVGSRVDGEGSEIGREGVEQDARKRSITADDACDRIQKMRFKLRGS
jgi:hypothetical protein